MSETSTLPGPSAPDPQPAASQIPLEHLEAQICELAGHLTAATCRWLVMIGDFDARVGYQSWDLPSCSAWLSWKCQMSPGTAREHVRVARALRDLPVIRAGFAAGRLSYAKVRALTRIATPATDADLADLAIPMTGAQLDRFARAHRQVRRADDDVARTARRVTWRVDDHDGSVAMTVRLPAAPGHILIQALRAAAHDLDHPHHGDSPASPGPGDADAPAEAPAAPGPTAEEESRPGAQGLADALASIAADYLAGKIATAANPDIYQVIVHVGPEALTTDNDNPVPAATSPEPALRAPAGAPTTESAITESAITESATADTDPAAATPATDPEDLCRPDCPYRSVGHPAHTRRCHIEDGPALSYVAAQRIACTATVSWMLHDHDGTLLDIGRRHRKPTAAQRRAVRERDHYRCAFPGCQSRRTDLHHIRHWARGGTTSFWNLICLCEAHHVIVHELGYLITRNNTGGFTFTRPNGTTMAASPRLPEPAAGDITTRHDAPITPDTIQAAAGERMNLHLSIWAAFANARINRERADRRAESA